MNNIGMVALISGGRSENLGKIVYVVGRPEDARLPDFGGTGLMLEVHMVSGPLIGPDEIDYYGGKIGENCLSMLNFTMEQARSLRERGMMKVVEMALIEMYKEEFWGEAPED